MTQRRLILIGGPTASGKSALAVQMAQNCAGTVINADAMQIYAGLPVLTAQPAAADKQAIPHLLYEIMDAAEASSAGKWLALALQAIEDVWRAGRTPIVTGGTGMYFRALTEGLADIPPIPDEVRAAASTLYDELGEAKFRDLLRRIDPAGADSFAANDRQRLIRAYEVACHTGKPIHIWQREGGRALPDCVIERHVVMPPREVLYTRCDARFIQMMEMGAIEEVRSLMARALNPDLPAMKILGVREIAAFLCGEVSRDDAVVRAQQMTRNYAKRQMTWFRNQWAGARVC